MRLKPLIKSCVYHFAYLIKHQSRLLNRIKYDGYIPILSLHRVSDDNNAFWPPLHPTLFDELLGFLRRYFEIVTFNEIDQIHSDKPKLILSFDDGYYDFIEYAMPILQKHRLKANQNIIPSQLLGEKPLWNIAFYDFLNAAPESLIKEIRFAGFDAKHLCHGRINKTRVGLEVSRVLKQLTFHDREIILNQLEQELFVKLENYPKTRMIRLHEMSDVISEHEVGVHSYSHNNMKHETMDYFIEDFIRCKEFFATHAFPNMDIYAFPNGSYRNEQVEYLQQNGIKHILLVGDDYATTQSPYNRFNIAASNKYEAFFQALGIKSKLNKYFKLRLEGT